MSATGRASEPISGHVFRVERVRGPAWYAKYRLPDGRQVQKKIGPAFTGRGRPAAGTFTKRTAQAWLDDVLAAARRRELPGMTSAPLWSLRRDRLISLTHQQRRKPTNPVSVEPGPAQAAAWIVERYAPPLSVRTLAQLERQLAQQVLGLAYEMLEEWLRDAGQRAGPS